MITKQEYDSLPEFKKFIVVDSFGDKYRASKEPGGTMFKYAPGKSRRGWRYDADTFCQQFTIVSANEGEVWKKRVNKVVRKLETSGLWPDMLEKYKNLSLMSYEDKLKINEIYWNDFRQFRDTGDTKEEKFNHIKECYGDLVDKYPFVFNKDGYINTFYIWEMSEAKTKSMYFGKYRNRMIKDQIKDALLSKRKCSFRERVNYDVSFEYDPDKGAWYSEEYKDCGNGHYYIAIDANTALFCEND